MLLQHFPYLQTIIGGVIAYLLGWMWYHPRVMGARWLDARGLTPEEGVNPKVFPSLISFGLWMLTSCFYSFLVIGFKLDPVGLLCFSCLLWVAFAMPATVMGALYTGRPFSFVAIDSAYQLCGYYVLAVVHIAFGAAGLPY